MTLRLLAQWALETYPLIKKIRSPIDKVITYVRFAQAYSRILVAPPASFLSQSKRFLGNLNLAETGVGRNIRQFTPVKIAAFKIHFAVTVRWILPQNAVKGNQRLENLFPRNLTDIPEIAYVNAQTIRLARITDDRTSMRSDLFQKD